LKQELKLTDKQVEEIIAVNSAYRLKFFQNRNDARAIETLRIEQRKDVDKLLTTEQKKKFADLDFRAIRGGFRSGLCSW
jgi:hypothetical protein